MAEYEHIDDVSIPNTDRLFRRVPPNQLSPNDDGTHRPSSSVFKHLEMSVNIESLMIEQERQPEDSLKDYPNEYLTSIIAGDVRSFGCYPIIKDNEPPKVNEVPKDLAHGLVLGKKKDSFANKMVRGHKWIVQPPKASSVEK